MGTSILVIVLSLHKRLSIARPAFETRHLVLYLVHLLSPIYCKGNCIYIPRSGHKSLVMKSSVAVQRSP